MGVAAGHRGVAAVSNLGARDRLARYFTGTKHVRRPIRASETMHASRLETPGGQPQLLRDAGTGRASYEWLGFPERPRSP